MVTETLIELPAGTADEMVVVAPPICVPEANLSMNELVQAQVPVFLTDQVFVKEDPAVRVVPSGIVTSLTYAAL